MLSKLTFGRFWKCGLKGFCAFIPNVISNEPAHGRVPQPYILWPRLHVLPWLRVQQFVPSRYRSIGSPTRSCPVWRPEQKQNREQTESCLHCKREPECAVHSTNIWVSASKPSRLSKASATPQQSTIYSLTADLTAMDYRELVHQLWTRFVRYSAVVFAVHTSHPAPLGLLQHHFPSVQTARKERRLCAGASGSSARYRLQCYQLVLCSQRVPVRADVTGSLLRGWGKVCLELEHYTYRLSSDMWPVDFFSIYPLANG